MTLDALVQQLRGCTTPEETQEAMRHCLPLLSKSDLSFVIVCVEEELERRGLSHLRAAAKGAAKAAGLEAAEITAIKERG